MNARNCQECSKSLPDWAEFCPFCGEKYRATAMLQPVVGPGEVDGPVKTKLLFLGTTDDGFDSSQPQGPSSESAESATVRPARTEKLAPTSVVVNHDALARFDAPTTASAPVELDDWEFEEETISFRSRSQVAIAAICALITVGALIAGAVVLSSESPEDVAEMANADIAEPAKEVAEPELAPLPELLDFDVRSEGPTQASVYYGARQVLELKTSKGSRYDSVEQRAKSVTVRLTHVAKKQRGERLDEGRFVARMNGDRYEIVWDDGSKHPFRVKDVTRHDVKKKGELAIKANLEADALTDLFRTKIAPVTRPNS